MSCAVGGSRAECCCTDVSGCEKGFSPRSQAGSFPNLPEACVPVFPH